MKFDWKNGLIWISFELDYEGSKYEIENCIVDTGSATSAVDIDLVDFNFQKDAVITRLFGIGGGTQEVITQTVDSIRIDDYQISNIELEFGNIYSNIGINGFIGNDLLGLFVVKIDYSQLIIDFKKETRPDT